MCDPAQAERWWPIPVGCFPINGVEALLDAHAIRTSSAALEA
jgi:hypothetical protein